MTTTATRYYASVTHPGYLEQVDAHGVHSVGTFRGGVFTPIESID